VDDLHRLLDLAQRELAAVDARVEIGGRPPAEPHVLWTRLTDELRLVVVLDGAPDDREALQGKLDALAESVQSLAENVDVPFAGQLPLARQAEVDETLRDLAERTHACAAVVLDERSPVIWGTSVTRAAAWDLDRMEELVTLADRVEREGLDPVQCLAEGPPTDADVDPTLRERWAHRFARVAALAPTWDADRWRSALLVARATHEVRVRCKGGQAPDRVALSEPGFGVFARSFANLYAVVLAFDGPYSELHAEGPLLRAMPVVERLVLALPPVEPPPRRAKVIAFRRR
jgi:hypothetical protein